MEFLSDQLKVKSFKEIKKLYHECDDDFSKFEIKMYLGNLINFNENDETECGFVDRILSVNKECVTNFYDFKFYYNPEETNVENWMKCPKCGNRPKIWIFDNGCKTQCRCATGRYDGFSVCIESINSVLCRTKGFSEYKGEIGLMEAWNRYCEGNVNNFFKPQFDENGKLIIW